MKYLTAFAYVEQHNRQRVCANYSIDIFLAQIAPHPRAALQDSLYGDANVAISP